MLTRAECRTHSGGVMQWCSGAVVDCRHVEHCFVCLFETRAREQLGRYSNQSTGTEGRGMGVRAPARGKIYSLIYTTFTPALMSTRPQRIQRGILQAEKRPEREAGRSIPSSNVAKNTRNYTCTPSHFMA
jgi:hypothetical protein